MDKLKLSSTYTKNYMVWWQYSGHAIYELYLLFTGNEGDTLAEDDDDENSD